MEDPTDTVVVLVDHATRFVSRSEAKQVMRGLERFRRVELDLAGVEEVGQGFVDEALRVWPSQHAGTVVTPTRMVGPVAWSGAGCPAPDIRHPREVTRGPGAAARAGPGWTP